MKRAERFSKGWAWSSVKTGAGNSVPCLLPWSQRRTCKRSGWKGQPTWYHLHCPTQVPLGLWDPVQGSCPQGCQDREAWGQCQAGSGRSGAIILGRDRDRPISVAGVGRGRAGGWERSLNGRPPSGSPRTLSAAPPPGDPSGYTGWSELGEGERGCFSPGMTPGTGTSFSSLPPGQPAWP